VTLSGEAWQSVLVLDSELADDLYMVSGLTAATNYTLSVTAVSVAGQSDNVVITNSTTSSVGGSTAIWIIVTAAAVIPVLVLALIGVYTCGRCVPNLFLWSWLP